jgi:peptide/nickel transport system substrate-binding protein
MAGKTVSRRTLIAGFGTALALAACGPATPTPTPVPAKPTEAPKQAAAPATTKPAEAPKPTEPAKPAAFSGAAPATSLEGVMTPPEPNAKRGGEAKLAWGITTAHFDIHQGGSSNAMCHLYSNLIRWNLGDGLRTIIPDLAERWEVSPDQKQYTFKLRGGVKFSDGTPFSADDVMASLNRIVDPQAGIVSPNKALYSVVSGIDKTEDMTVRITLREPRAYFLKLLADPSTVMYSKKALDGNQGDLKKVIAPGTGPFILKEHQQAERWVFERNPNYWEPGLPLLDRLVLLHVPAWTDRGTAVLTGQADMSWNVSVETWDEGKTRPNEIGASELRNFGAYAIIFNSKNKPFDDPRVRRAIHLAVSRADLLKAFQTQERVAPKTRWIPHGDPFATAADQIAKLPGYRDDKNEDIQTAKKLLAEAGFPNGFGPVDFLSASVAPHAEIMAPAFQDQLKRTLNIDAKIRTQERALLSQEQEHGKFDIVVDTPGHLLSDIAPIGSAYWQTGGSRNWGGYSNKQFDELLTKYDGSTDEGKRKEWASQMQEILDQDPPWYLIGYTFHIPMWRKPFKGLMLDNRAFALWGQVSTAWVDT